MVPMHEGSATTSDGLILVRAVYLIELEEAYTDLLETVKKKEITKLLKEIEELTENE